MATYNFRTTTAGGALQKDSNPEHSPINSNGYIDRDSVAGTLTLNIGVFSETIIFGTDTVIIDGVTFTGTAQALQDKIQIIFNTYNIG